MKIRSAAGACLLTCMLFAMPAQPQILSPVPPDVWPTEIDGPLTPALVIILIRDRNFAALWRLAKDAALAYARDQILHNANLPYIGGQLAMRLRAIIDDPAKPPLQKYDELLQLTDNSLEPTKSPASGVLNVTLQHSIELGVTRLEWDDKARTGSQSGGQVTTNCVGWTGQMSCTESASYSTCFYRSQPEYYIYRVVNGQETLITRIQGSLVSSGDVGITFNDSLFQSAWSAAKYYYTVQLSGKYPDVKPGRAFFYDFQADLREPGTTLSYKVISSDDFFVSPYVCGARTGKTYTATVVSDGNGDGRMDYLPAADYAKYAGKYTSWLPAVLGVLE